MCINLDNDETSNRSSPRHPWSNGTIDGCGLLNGAFKRVSDEFEERDMARKATWFVGLMTLSSPWWYAPLPHPKNGVFNLSFKVIFLFFGSASDRAVRWDQRFSHLVGNLKLKRSSYIHPSRPCVVLERISPVTWQNLERALQHATYRLPTSWLFHNCCIKSRPQELRILIKGRSHPHNPYDNSNMTLCREHVNK